MLCVQIDIFMPISIENGVCKSIRQHTFAYIDGCVDAIYRINSQVQGDGTVAAQSGLEGEVIIVLHFVISVVVFIHITLADLGVKVGMLGRIDGEVQCYGAVAIVHRASVENVVSAGGSFCKNSVTPGIRQLILADGLTFVLLINRIYH